MASRIDGTNGLIQNYIYFDGTTAPAITPSATFTYTVASGVQNVILNPSSTVTSSVTITLPANPVDGMTVSISTTQQINLFTVSAAAGQTINNAVTNLGAGSSISYIYRSTSSSWFAYTSVSGAKGASSFSGPRAQYFTTVGTGQTFTIPAGITNIKVTVIGGGGGGGGAGLNCGGYVTGSSGGVGGAGVQWFTGLTPGNTLTVAVGAAGSAGSYSPSIPGGTGGTGGTSSVASGTQTITTIQATGGGGGGGGGGSGTGSNGAATGAAISTPNIGPYSFGKGNSGSGGGGGPGGAGVAGAVLIEY